MSITWVGPDPYHERSRRRCFKWCNKGQLPPHTFGWPVLSTTLVHGKVYLSTHRLSGRRSSGGGAACSNRAALYFAKQRPAQGAESPRVFPLMATEGSGTPTGTPTGTPQRTAAAAKVRNSRSAGATHAHFAQIASHRPRARASAASAYLTYPVPCRRARRTDA